jgi:hypothetical protein
MDYTNSTFDGRLMDFRSPKSLSDRVIKRVSGLVNRSDCTKVPPGLPESGQESLELTLSTATSYSDHKSLKILLTLRTHGYAGLLQVYSWLLACWDDRDQTLACTHPELPPAIPLRRGGLDRSEPTKG